MVRVMSQDDDSTCDKRDYELNIKVISKSWQVSEITVDCHEWKNDSI